MTGSATGNAPEKRTGLDTGTAILIFTLVSLVITAGLFVINTVAGRRYRELDTASRRFVAAQKASSMMETGSDYLTEKVRSFVVTGDLRYLNEFFEEVRVTQRREKAVSDLEKLLPDRESPAFLALAEALNLSNALIAYENHAMCLVLDAGSYDGAQIPEELKNLELPQKERGMSETEKQHAAVELVFGEIYSDYKTRIREQADICTEALITEAQAEMDAMSERLNTVFRIETAMIAVEAVAIIMLAFFLSKELRQRG